MSTCLSFRLSFQFAAGSALTAMLFIMSSTSAAVPVHAKSVPSTVNVEIITSTILKPITFGSYNMIGPAYQTALKEMNAAYQGRINFTQQLIYDRSLKIEVCTEWGQESDVQTAKYFFNGSDSIRDRGPRVQAFIFAACGDLLNVFNFGTSANKVVISVSLGSPQMKDKVNFPTLLTTGLWSSSVYTALYLELFRTYSWSSIMILLDMGSNFLYHMLVLDTVEAVVGTTINVNVIRVMLNTTRDSVDKQLNSAFTRFKEISRVMAIFADGSRMFGIMEMAHRMNMTDGSFIYLLSPPYTAQFFQTAVPKVLQSTETEACALKKALRSCLFISVEGKEYNFGLPDGEVHPFVNRWKADSLALNYTYKPNEKAPSPNSFQHAAVFCHWGNGFNRLEEGAFTVSPNALSSYAAMTILGQVVSNLTLQNASFDYNDGAALARQFLNRSFRTSVGEMTFNEFGERVPTVVISFIDPAKPSAIQVAFARASRTQKLALLQEPAWPGPWPVPNVPHCGYRGDSLQCLSEGLHVRNTTIGGGTGAILCFLLIVALIIRRLHMDFVLAQLWWSIDTCLLIPVTRNFRSTVMQRCKI